MEKSSVDKTMKASEQKLVVNQVQKLHSSHNQIVDNIAPKHCNCKGGKCRQLYCVCLKAGRACAPGLCQCVGCLNDDSKDAIAARDLQKRAILEAVRKGCNCRRNYCRKNYCICHGSGLMCDPKLCHCESCYNYEGAPPVPTNEARGAEPKKRRKQEAAKIISNI